MEWNTPSISSFSIPNQTLSLSPSGGHEAAHRLQLVLASDRQGRGQCRRELHQEGTVDAPRELIDNWLLSSKVNLIFKDTVIFHFFHNICRNIAITGYFWKLAHYQFAIHNLFPSNEKKTVVYWKNKQFPLFILVLNKYLQLTSGSKDYAAFLQTRLRAAMRTLGLDDVIGDVVTGKRRWLLIFDLWTLCFPIEQ